MRILVVITFIITAVSLIYKWRYRVMNTILAVSFLRRAAVALSMNMPTIRTKIFPGLFTGNGNQSIN
ncbi:hypothetical protein CIL05_13895 [Virgibacillus profundi]|uniref:Uncharacterized protein n=2 Tax=Virgibacillus profundi TaxID=2024555 RepID=A0A2A2IBW9_9BACI|nr:hypothetical protein CIL05_13895 [Virgibacillus profundi]PXY53231.1 hypothetical protein CIT14_14020 [Virgibacillus profundi]